MSMRTDRRTFLKGLAVSAGSAPLFLSSTARAQGGHSDHNTPSAAEGEAARSRMPIAVQLYSVREEAATDLPGVLKSIKAMGYEGVEFAGYYGHTAEQLKQLLDDTGLACVGTHVSIDTLLGDEFEKSVEFHATLGNTRAIVPGLAGEYTATADAWRKTADTFNEIAARLKPHGMRTGYHNHHTEFAAFDSGELPWDIFFGNTSDDVIMQLDAGNAFSSGSGVLRHLRAYPGRATTVHLKPCSPSLATEADSHAIWMPVIGEDEVPWAELLETCATTAGTECYIVEYESTQYPPMEAIDICLRNLKELLVVDPPPTARPTGRTTRRGSMLR